MRRTLAIAVLALAAAVPAAADPPPPGIYDASTDGKALYGGNCATCHGSLGEGRTSAPLRGVGNRPGLGPSLRGVGALAADFYLRTGYMPLKSPSAEPRRSRVLFTDRQLDALIAYVASLGNGPPVHSDVKLQFEGTRIKHWVEHNSIKLYDFLNVLRPETTINNPHGFRVYRTPENDPDRAPSDGPNMVPLRALPALLETLIAFDRLAKSRPAVMRSAP